MVIINEEKCIGCGLCVNDCFPRNIKVVDKKAKLVKPSCMQCGHCVAICPKNAVSIYDYDMDSVEDVTETTITPDELLKFIKSRRSIRQFNDKKVEQEKIEKIIEAGRYSATGSNKQDLTYIVMQDKLQDFRKLVIESLDKKADVLLANDDTTPTFKYYAKLWKEIAKGYKADPTQKDIMFLGAPALILISSSTAIDAGIAVSNMELMADSLGLGALYSGFITSSCSDNDLINEFLNVKDGFQVNMCLVLGYSDVKYPRTAPRKSPSIQWM